MFIAYSSDSVTNTNIPPGKPILALLNEDIGLISVLQRLKAISKLQKTYFDAAPENLKNSSRVTRIDGTTLVISVPNGAIATKIKLLTPALLQCFTKNKKQEQKVTAICVEVQPDLLSTTPPVSNVHSRHAIPLSGLDALSRQLTDSPLKNMVDTLRHNCKQRDIHNRKNRSNT